MSVVSHGQLGGILQASIEDVFSLQQFFHQQEISRLILGSESFNLLKKKKIKTDSKSQQNVVKKKARMCQLQMANRIRRWKRQFENKSGSGAVVAH